MATIMEAAFQKALLQGLAAGVKDYVGVIDKFARSIITKREAVEAGLGREWIAKCLLGTGEAGSMRYGTALSGPSEAAVGTLAHFHGVADSYPGVDEHVYPNIKDVDVRLVRAVCNLFVPAVMMRVDKLDLMKVKYIERLVKGFSQKIARRKVRTLYKQPGTSVSKIIGTIDEITAGGSAGDAYVTFKPTSSSIHNYSDGQLVELWIAAGTTRRHSPGATLSSSGKYVMVDGVDYIGGKVTLKVKDGTNWSTQVLTTDVIIDVQDPAYDGSTIVNAAQTPHDPDGFFSWIKHGLADGAPTDDGLLFGSEACNPVNVASYPFLKSLIKDMVTEFGAATPLSPSLLNRYVGAFEFAFPDANVTDLLVDPAALRCMLDGFDAQVTFDGQGQPIAPVLGYKANSVGDNKEFYVPFHSPSGKMYRVRGGIDMPQGTLIGLNAENNIFEITAPDIGGSYDRTWGAGEIEFVAPFLYNNKSIWAPVNAASTSALTAMRQAPAEIVHCYTCDDPRSIKLTGLQRLTA
jgi:hypothetical protein